MLMISLISAGIILVDRMYYMREQEENNRVQAKFYAESAITLVQQDILKEGTVTDETTGATYQSIFVSDGNTAETFTISLPDAGNWKCTVTVNHSVVNDSETDASKRRLSGEIYLTAKVTRNTAGSGERNCQKFVESCQFPRMRPSGGGTAIINCKGRRDKMRKLRKGTTVVEVVIAFAMISMSFAIGMIGMLPARTSELRCEAEEPAAEKCRCGSGGSCCGNF